MPLCAQCGQDNPEIARFCLACGASLAEPAPATEERKLVTGVFVDVVGSTARSEQLDPEDVRAMLGPYHARVKTELERYGGTVEKFIGDAVFALFGAPVAHEDDPERAVRAALAVRNAVAELNRGDAWLDLHIRVGVTTGEALVMLDARPSQGDWMAAGDVVNTAARLQSAAPRDGILVGQLTYEATRHAIEYRDAEPVTAKGKAEPVPVWEVGGLRESPAPRRERLPLVGRESELEELEAVWADTLERRGGVLATLVAPPGVGKSRLLHELAERVADSAVVHWSRCLSYGEGITYWPVTEIVKSAAGILQSDDAETMSLKLGGLLNSLPTRDEDELRTMAAALANLIDAPATPRGTYSARDISQAELHWGIRRVVELLAGFRPLVLVFEDLHWAEPTLLELLRYLAGASAPMLVIGSARPELAEHAADFLAANRAVLRLEALDAESSRALLGRLLEGTDVPPDAVETLLRNAGGNPLFLEETVRMLEAAGGVVEGLPVPTSLRSLIGSRLDQLPGAEKKLAQNASVVGAVFWSGAVAHLNGTGDVDSGLEALERRDFVRTQLESSVAGQREYAFKHILIRDVAYGQLPKGRRAGLHLQFADWVTLLPGGEDDFVEIIAYHLEQSCRLAGEVEHSPVEPPVDAAVQMLTRAAEKAERREGFREAERFYTRALELVVDLEGPAALELALRRGRALIGLGELRRAHDELAAVAAAALTSDRREVRCEALVALANIDYKLGRGTLARAALVEAEELAAALGDRALQIRATYESAQLRERMEGEPETAVESLRQGLAAAEALNDRALRIEGHMRLGTILFNISRLPEAEEQFARGAEIARELGSHRDEARTTVQLAYLAYYHRGEAETAEQLALQALAWLERTGDSDFQLQASLLLGILALARDKPDRAEQRLRYALPLALESGGWHLLEIYRALVEALVRQGRINDAAKLAEFAERHVQPEDTYARGTVLLAQATVAVAGGDDEVGGQRFARALELLADQVGPLDLVEARLAWARALRRAGDGDGARAQLQLAHDTFATIDAPGLLADVERELVELASGAGAPGPARRSLI